MPRKQKWQRVINENTGKYGYVLIDNKNKPVQFNQNTGYYRVYNNPSVNSPSYNAYNSPTSSTKDNTIPNIQLQDLVVTAPKLTEPVGIQITPNIPNSSEKREIDEKINQENDQLQHSFANLLTLGMLSPVQEGAKDMQNGQYTKGIAKMATPIMFGPAESTVANLTRLGVGAYDLANENGVSKTWRLANNGDWSGAAKSAAGDALNLGMTLGGGYNFGKYNIPSFVQQAARNGNNTARSYLISKELNQNVRNFDGTVGEEYFQNPVPYRWVRVSETPEVHGLQEMGKNVTTTDAYNIHVPTNDWRMAHIKDFTFKDGQWYKKPKKKFSLTKFGSAHGDTSQAAYGKVWDGTFAYSGQFPKVRLEGEAYNKLYRGFDPNTGSDSRTNFSLQNVDDIPMGSRVGFHTGEMPMENLQYFQQLPNGRWAIKGQILPNKNLYIDTSKTTEPTTIRYQFDSPTYQMYTGPQHDISEVINVDGSVNLRNLLNIQNEALKNIPGGTIARHRLENKKWHPTDWNTFLHTRDVYKRALQYNYPKEALFPTLMHDAGKLWAGDGHGPYGASIIQQIFPKASKEQIQAIYGHMEANPGASLTRFVKGVDIKEPNQFRYLGFERPNNLSFRERIGLSKGSYNDLDKYQKDALSDLEQFYTNGQYRNKFAYNPNTGKFEYTNILSDGKVPGVQKIADTDNYKATEYFIRSGNGKVSYHFKLNNGSIHLVPNGQTFGEMSAWPLTSYSKQIRLTSPKVDMLDSNPDLIQEAAKLPDKIDKQSMKEFWDGVQQTTKPGTYLSGDNGVAPLGHQLISSYKDKNLSQAINDLLANNYDVDNIHMRSGLSPDSYYSIIRQGLRPEHSLRFSRNGFTKLNDSAVDNKDLYQMWKSATTPEAKQQFVSTWNNRIYPNSSFINNKGQIEFLHPFVYYKKFGGKLNNNGQSK